MTEDEAIQEYEGFVKSVVLKATRHLPDYVDRGPLLNAGRFGLVDALRKYDPSLGAQFKSYAGLRIRGEVLDEIRRSSSWSRWAIKKLEELESARFRLEEERAREVHVWEVLDFLGIRGQRRKQYERLLESREAVGLEEVKNLPSGNAVPGDALEQEDSHRCVRDGVAQLSPRDQSFLDLFYEQGMKGQDIAERFGITPSAISQIHKRTIEKLRKLCLKELLA